MIKFKNKFSIEGITFLVSIVLTIFYNNYFWSEILATKKTFSFHVLLSLFSVELCFASIQWFVFLIFVNRFWVKTFIYIVFILSSITAYFVLNFHTAIDSNILHTVLETSWVETKEYLNLKLLSYILFLGILPSLIIKNINIIVKGFLFRCAMILLSFCLIISSYFGFSYEYAPIFREKSELIFYMIPLNIVFALYKNLRHIDSADFKAKNKMGEDAKLVNRKINEKPRVIIFVLGETVRAHNWGLNGRKRQTTPQLKKQQVINFSDVSSCGTLTNISVPCIFSPYGAHAYNKKNIENSESLLHVLNKANISVLWRDNQDGCKGVCDGLRNERPFKKEICKSGQCFDEVLLHKLKKEISSNPKDQFIVLHMIGNHGPAYFERYPKKFNHWQPICHNTDLSQCSHKALINTYDNVILYTDKILSELIDLLKTLNDYNTGLIYVSDHGESLGEHGLFLHGIPYFMAPDEQKKVPLVFWLSSGLSQDLKLNATCLRKKEFNPISHDYIFSTILKMYGVDTALYDSKYDLMNGCIM